MKEKNMSTFFLIIAVITIIIMIAFIYKFNNDKNVEIQKSKDLQIQVNTLNETINDLQEKINSLSENIDSNKSNEVILSNKEYKISGTYCQKNAQGDEPTYTFSENNSVTYGSLWMCSGTYTISNDIIEISFTSAVDPDGNIANVKDYGVEESVKLTIIDNDNLKDDSNGIIYSKIE